ncbi:hypothetical protein HPB47_023543 [Ixodes persulcatus]|uniref:Uncharacterized protein n=1 Tax=Ixodes persulcatus TaxID=34615 RepID=A0AC60Q9X5_IXOPE|nr:hypothetical protein HPB47_023543 [Ixodes persulcatus]
MSWRSKKRILRAYREGATRRIQELRGACDRLWIQLLGEDYKLHRDFQHWENIRKAQFHRLCRQADLELPAVARGRGGPVSRGSPPSSPVGLTHYRCRLRSTNTGLRQRPRSEREICPFDDGPCAMPRARLDYKLGATTDDFSGRRRRKRDSAPRSRIVVMAKPETTSPHLHASLDEVA